MAGIPTIEQIVATATLARRPQPDLLRFIAPSSRERSFLHARCSESSVRRRYRGESELLSAVTAV